MKHACNHHDHAHDTNHSCVLLVPIFNHLENDQMDEIMATAQSVTYKKRRNHLPCRRPS